MQSCVDFMLTDAKVVCFMSRIIAWRLEVGVILGLHFGLSFGFFMLEEICWWYVWCNFDVGVEACGDKAMCELFAAYRNREKQVKWNIAHCIRFVQKGRGLILLVYGLWEMDLLTRGFCALWLRMYLICLLHDLRLFYECLLHNLRTFQGVF